MFFSSSLCRSSVWLYCLPHWADLSQHYLLQLLNITYKLLKFPSRCDTWTRPDTNNQPAELDNWHAHAKPEPSYTPPRPTLTFLFINQSQESVVCFEQWCGHAGCSWVYHCRSTSWFLTSQPVLIYQGFIMKTSCYNPPFQPVII